MSEPATVPARMTADEFLIWAIQQPEGRHYELVAGEVVEMAAERAAHAKCKGRIYRRFAEAIEAAGLQCEAYPDGMAVEVDAETIYEPDAMVRCGKPLPDNTVRVADPLILVEVRSPSSGPRDAGAKLADYFRLASVRHYLIALTESRTVIHHCRDAAGIITTRMIRDAPVPLDPPGIVLDGIFGSQTA